MGENMDISLQKRTSARYRAVLAGLGVLGCCVFANLMFADVSSAAAPAGIDCAASDGKISGRGSTYQSLLQGDLIAAYTSDFCGTIAEQYAGDPAGNTMVAYNYPAAESAGATGSGAGTKAASCRTDAFWGSDTPYTEETLKGLDEAPGKFGGSACTLAFTPPYQPQAKENKFPNAEDITAPIMSFPVAGSSVAIIVNFGTACKKAPTGLALNAKEASRLFGGDVATWADRELGENNASLATDGCTGAVTRVVRQDSSGTTNIFKQYLIRAENERTGQACAAGKKWEAYFATNTEWPGKQKPSEEGTCSAITTAAKSGNPELIAKVKETAGGVGYADLPQAVGNGFVIATVQNATGTSFIAPANGRAANCSYTSVQPPAGGASEAVGLSPEGKNWANNAEPNEENVADLGSKYPICGLTWDLVFTGLSNTSTSAIAPLTADQRRTLYSYITFLLSSTAQNSLATIDYAPLPAAWLLELREGFQENF
jgi:ABC-type phosphate transport system substrate-binding protein